MRYRFAVIAILAAAAAWLAIQRISEAHIPPSKTVLTLCVALGLILALLVEAMIWLWRWWKR